MIIEAKAKLLEQKGFSKKQIGKMIPKLKDFKKKGK